MGVLKYAKVSPKILGVFKYAKVSPKILGVFSLLNTNCEYLGVFGAPWGVKDRPRTALLAPKEEDPLPPVARARLEIFRPALPKR